MNISTTKGALKYIEKSRYEWKKGECTLYIKKNYIALFMKKENVHFTFKKITFNKMRERARERERERGKERERER